MRSVAVKDSRVIAAGTSLKGKCVVTSATRKGDPVAPIAPPMSIITTRGTSLN